MWLRFLHSTYLILDASEDAKPSDLAPELRRKAVLSCYRTLIRLGDLSRYRTTELEDPDKRRWGPAVGYYSLAGEIWPGRA